MRELIQELHEAADPLKAFMSDWRGSSHPNPIDGGQRMVGFKKSGWMLVELKIWDGTIHISWMQVVPGDERKGAATKTLTKLTKMADKHGVRMGLQAIPTGSPKISKGKLKGLYRKFGFKVDHGDYMVREPQAVREQMETLLEGLIKPPPALYQRIKEWMISVAATKYVKHFQSERDKDPETYDPMIARWKPLINHRVKVSDYGPVATKVFTLKRKDSPILKRMPRGKMPLTKITVQLVNSFHAAGGFSATRGLIVLPVPGSYDPQKLVKDFDRSDEGGNILRHELIHLTQMLMSGVAKSASDPSEDGVAVRRAARPGMPSKRIMTPKVTQYGQGGTEFAQTRDDLKAQGRNPDLVTHRLDDIEFYTALADAVDALKAFPLKDLSRTEKNKVIGIYTGSIKAPDPKNRKAWVRFDPNRAFYDFMYPGALGAHRRKPLKPSPTFLIWKRHARGKWRKAVKELTKAV
jgi:hypothetical protein